MWNGALFKPLFHVTYAQRDGARHTGQSQLLSAWWPRVSTGDGARPKNWLVQLLWKNMDEPGVVENMLQEPIVSIEEPARCLHNNHCKRTQYLEFCSASFVIQASYLTLQLSSISWPSTGCQLGKEGAIPCWGHVHTVQRNTVWLAQSAALPSPNLIVIRLCRGF